MAIREQGFTESVNLAQRGFGSITGIGETIARTGSFIEQKQQEAQNLLEQQEYNDKSLQLRKDLDNLYQDAKAQDKNNLTHFKSQKQALREQIEENATSERLKLRLLKEFDEKSYSFETKIAKTKEQEIKQEILSSQKSFITSNIEEIKHSLFEGQTQRAVEKGKEALDTIDKMDLNIEQKRIYKENVFDIIEDSNITKTSQIIYEDLKDKIENENFLDENKIEGLFNRINEAINNPDDNKELLATQGFTVKEGKIYHTVTQKRITVEEKQKLKNQLEEVKQKSINQFLLKNEKHINNKNNTKKSMFKALQNGIQVSLKDINIFKDKFNNVLTEEDQDFLNSIQEYNNISNMTPNAAFDYINKTYEKDFIKKQSYLSFVKEARIQEIKDPINFYKNKKMLPNQIISLEQGVDNFIYQIKERGNRLNDISEERDITINKTLTEQEINVLDTQYSTLNNKDKINLITELKNNLGLNKVRDIALRVNNKNQKSTLLNDLRLSEKIGNNKVNLSLINNGKTILKENKDFFKELDIDEDLKIHQVIRKEITGLYNTNTYSRFFHKDMENIKGALVSLMVENNADTPEDYIEQAIKTAIGNTVEKEYSTGFFSGEDYKIFTPNSNISAEDFNLMLEELKEEDLENIDKLPKGIDKKELIKRIQDEEIRLEHTKIPNTEDYVYKLRTEDGYIASGNNVNNHFILGFKDVFKTGIEPEDLEKEIKNSIKTKENIDSETTKNIFTDFLNGIKKTYNDYKQTTDREVGFIKNDIKMKQDLYNLVFEDTVFEKNNFTKDITDTILNTLIYFTEKNNNYTKAIEDYIISKEEKKIKKEEAFKNYQKLQYLNRYKIDILTEEELKEILGED